MNFALILSGGTGSRMKMEGSPKQYISVAGKPILLYTLQIFEENTDTDAIVIVAAEEWQTKIRQWTKENAVTKFTAFASPGITRQESILHGLMVCCRYMEGESDVVVVHDAVRPLVSGSLISSCIATARQYGACMPVLPLHDTTYQSADGKKIDCLLDRNTLFAGQAPEAFRLKRYAEINRSVSAEELNHYNGSSEIAFRYHLDVRMIPGDDRNFKITTQADLERFREICAREKEAQCER